MVKKCGLFEKKCGVLEIEWSLLEKVFGNKCFVERRLCGVLVAHFVVFCRVQMFFDGRVR